MGTDFAIDLTKEIVKELRKEIRNIVKLKENRKDLSDDIERMEDLLDHMENQFQDPQKGPPKLVVKCLRRMNEALAEVKPLIDRVNEPLGFSTFVQILIGYCFLGKSRPSTEIKEWNAKFGQLFQQLQYDVTLCANIVRLSC